MFIAIVYKAVLLLVTLKSITLCRKFCLSAQNNLTIYLAITFSIEIFFFLFFYTHPNFKNGLFYNLYNIFCIIFFYFFYKIILEKKIRLVLSFITTAGLGFILLGTKFYSWEFDIRIGITTSLFYIMSALLWFLHKMNSFNKEKITDDPAFWISTAILMWSCFFIFRVTPMFFLDKNDHAFLKVLRTIQNIVNIIMYGMFFVALIQYEKRYTKSYPLNESSSGRY